jgi:hypothetical protein
MYHWGESQHSATDNDSFSHYLTYRNSARHWLWPLVALAACGAVVAGGALAQVAARLVQALAAVLAHRPAATVVQLHLTVGPGVAAVLALTDVPA